MGSTKKEQYSLTQLRYASIAKAIGHPARVAIIRHLAEMGMSNNYSFMAVTQLAEATVCQHLKELLGAGLIGETFLGNTHCYFLTPEATDDIALLKSVVIAKINRKRTSMKKRNA